MIHPFSRYRPMIDDWAQFTAALERPASVFVSPNAQRWSVAELDAWLSEMGWGAAPTLAVQDMRRLPAGTRLGGRWQFFAGLYQVMQWTSALAVHVLNPRPGERILDMCASPGMKTARLASLMSGTGTVVANELNWRRVKALRQTCERMGLLNVCLLEHDGGNLPACAGPFDRILVDAPCSCEGTTRKFSTQLHEADPYFRRSKTGGQAALLRKAVQLCRDGGTIVYCTCTYAPEENEGVVDTILGEYSDQVQLEEIENAASLGSPGVTEWEGRTFHDSMARTLRVWPHHHDSEGFFIARLRKLGPPRDETTPVPLAVEDSGDLRAWMVERFGLPAESLAMVNLHQVGERDAFALPKDLLPVTTPEPLQSGLLTLRTHLAVPKLTVPGALCFGPRASRNRLAISEEQAECYIYREVFAVATEQLSECTPGYVLLERDGLVMGLGLLQQQDHGWEVRSMFPKRWFRTRRC